MKDTSELPEFATDGPDLLGALDAFEPARELVRGFVAGFRADGFDDEGARALAVTTLTGYRWNPGGDE